MLQTFEFQSLGVMSAAISDHDNGTVPHSWILLQWREQNRPVMNRGGGLMRLVMMLLGLLTLIGCGGKAEPRRVAVRGSVIVGDKLVPDATVRFLPEPGNAGPVAWTSVSGGLYNFTKLDGPFPGKYKVSVNLELSSVSKIASDDPNAPLPPTQWEQGVTVPDRESATQHFLWKSADELKAETKP